MGSQHAVLLTRCSDSEARCAALEAESKVWAREREESVARMEALRRDHERMTALQQRQEVELEELLDKHSQLRSNNRNLEAQHRELEARYCTNTHGCLKQASLSICEDSWAVLRRVIQHRNTRKHTEPTFIP